MISKSQAIKRFLDLKAPPDLAALYGLQMECQVNVAQGSGEVVEGEFKGRKWRGYSDGIQTWKPIRIPMKANTPEPEFNDSEIKWDIAAHAEAIGMTGWDWMAKQSRWVAYDFDAIAGHSERHDKKLSTEQLQEVQKLACQIPWVSVRRSTSGNGLHLYVVLADSPQFKTETHTEHAAMARAILGKMSALTGFDFSSKVDACGGNLWVWHRKYEQVGGRNGPGLALIKKGEALPEAPLNWREHIKVTSGAKRRAAPGFVGEQVADAFEELCGQNHRIPLDDEHKKLIDFLEQSKAMWWFDQDHHMLVCHTQDLAKAHKELNLKGIFRTASSGSSEINCFCFGGDTEVITHSGVKTIRELAQGGSAKLQVLTDIGMRWIDCEIKSFGIQKTVPVLFGNNTLVNATQEHEWLVYRNGKPTLTNKKRTNELTNRTYLPLVQNNLPEPSLEGYAHGFVFGDGWEVSCHGKDSTQVAFFKDDVDLLDVIAKFGSSVGTREIVKGQRVPVVNGLPAHWKVLPKNPSREYAYGFILGLCAADGFVRGPSFQINQTNEQHLQEVRKLALWVGLRAGDVREASVGGYPNAKQPFVITLSTYNVKPEHFLRLDQRKAWSATENKSTSAKHIDFENQIEEEVFCAVVPIWHNFVLANGVITGNCYPMRKGAWSVRRYTQGVGEADTWEQDQAGWTRCYFNKPPDLKTAARSNGGTENEDRGFEFPSMSAAIATIRNLGGNVEVPDGMSDRKTLLKPHKDGRLIVQITRNEGDPAMAGWSDKKRGIWSKVLDIRAAGDGEPEVANHDDVIRHLLSDADGVDCGWVVRVDNQWAEEPLQHIRLALAAMGRNDNEIKWITGGSVMRPWRIVSRPFEPEFPGDRRWNRNAAKFAAPPNPDLDSLQYPHWKKILDHLGKNLDKAVLKDDWCKTHSIKTGSDYLKLWLAAMIQFPMEPLPLLFFYGPQDCGKSILWEGLRYIIDPGIKRVENALTSQQNFNAEIEGAVLGVIEELDLRSNKTTAYNRIKDYVTSRRIPIHRKNFTPYDIVNTLHLMHFANDVAYAVVLPGDKRLVYVQVDSLLKADQIPKGELEQHLQKQAPDFLAALLATDIPPTNSRLRIPPLETEEKDQAARETMNEVELFCAENGHYVEGAHVLLSEWFERFNAWLDPDLRTTWGKGKAGREIPKHFPKGRLRNQGAPVAIGNFAWEPREEPLGPAFVLNTEKGTIDNPRST